MLRNVIFLVRNYRPVIIKKNNEIDLKYNSYYIAGMVGDNVYMGNATAPLHLLITNIILTDTQHIRMNIRNRKDHKLTRVLNVKVDSPYFYLADGKMPGFFQGKIGEWQAERLINKDAYFDQSLPIGDSLFAIRTKSSVNMEYELGVITKDTPYVRIEHSLLEKQIDGSFCVDGWLNFSKELDKLIYTYYYRNEFIVYDRNLNLDYRGHTIDTFSTAQLKIAEIKSDRAKTLTSRSKIINALSRVSGNYLFIYSTLLAKNDHLDALQNSTIIDVYDLKNNLYKFSFLIPNHKEKKVSRFQVFNNEILVATHDRYLVTYNIKLDFSS